MTPHTARVVSAAGERMVGVNRCPEVPTSPQDGDRFTCPRCGYYAEFVVLDDGKPGEWVGVTQPETHETAPQPEG